MRKRWRVVGRRITYPHHDWSGGWPMLGSGVVTDEVYPEVWHDRFWTRWAARRTAAERNRDPVIGVMGRYTVERA